MGMDSAKLHAQDRAQGMPLKRGVSLFLPRQLCTYMHNLQKIKLKIYAQPAVSKKKDYFFGGFGRFSVL